ncbi:MAG TPA: tetratricopeptide repeat protein [Bdellovibrionota bacterium]|nr:tetratricopeptide repeat protein [Bdellovibrionota bacterium]
MGLILQIALGIVLAVIILALLPVIIPLIGIGLAFVLLLAFSALVIWLLFNHPIVALAIALLTGIVYLIKVSLDAISRAFRKQLARKEAHPLPDDEITHGFNRSRSLLKAQELFKAKKFQEALTEYMDIATHDPSDTRTLLMVGDLQVKIGQTTEGLETYRKVGEQYAGDGFFLKATAVFKQILKTDPSKVSVYLRLAELYKQLGLNSEAIKQYQVVVRHYENNGLKKESLDILRKMAELEPENTESKIKHASS